MTTMGEKLKAAREAASLSQSALGRRAHMDKSQISRYENEIVLPSMTSLHQLALALGLSLGQLLEGVEL